MLLLLLRGRPSGFDPGCGYELLLGNTHRNSGRDRRLEETGKCRIKDLCLKSFLPNLLLLHAEWAQKREQNWKCPKPGTAVCLWTAVGTALTSGVQAGACCSRAL